MSEPWEDFSGNTALAESPPWEDFSPDKDAPWNDFSSDKKESTVEISPLNNSGVFQPSQYSSGIPGSPATAQNPDFGVLSGVASSIVPPKPSEFSITPEQVPDEATLSEWHPSLWNRFRNSDVGKRLLGDTAFERELKSRYGGVEPSVGALEPLISNPANPFLPGAEGKIGKAIMGYFLVNSASQKPEQYRRIKQLFDAGETKAAWHEILGATIGLGFDAMMVHGLNESLHPNLETKASEIESFSPLTADALKSQTKTLPTKEEIYSLSKTELESKISDLKSQEPEILAMPESPERTQAISDNGTQTQFHREALQKITGEHLYEPSEAVKASIENAKTVTTPTAEPTNTPLVGEQSASESPEPVQKYRVGKNPTLHTLVEKLPDSEIEIANGEQPVSVKNEKTGEIQTVMESDLTPVSENVGNKTKKQTVTEKLKSLGYSDVEISSMPKDGAKALAERGEKKIVGMGGAIPEEFTNPSSTQEAQLMSELERIEPSSGVQSNTISMADRLGESVAQSKDIFSRWWMRTKAGAEQYRRLLFGAPLKEDSFWTPKKTWQANRQVNAGVAKEFIDQGKKIVPKQINRQAMGKYAQALAFDNPEEVISKWAAESKLPSNRRKYESAKNLSEGEKQMAKQMVQYFEAKGRELQELGLVNNLIEDYAGQHMVDMSKDAPESLNSLRADLVRGTFNTNFKYAMRRMFETEFDLEQAGHKLRTDDLFDKVANYAKTANDVLADRSAIRQWMDGETSDGKPLFATGKSRDAVEGDGVKKSLFVNPKVRPNPTWKDANGVEQDISGEYVKIDHPSFKKWQWVETTPEGKQIFVQGDVWAHKSIADELKNTFGRSRLYDIPGIDTATRVNAQLKGIKLVGLFHQVKTGSHALFHLTRPFGQEMPNPHSPEVYDAMRHGLQLFDTRASEVFSEGLASSSVLQSVANLVPALKLGDTLRAYQEYLFHEYIPSIKWATYQNALKRNISRYGDVPEWQLKQITAQQMNSAFGEQNWKLLGVNPTFQHGLRLSLLAPDFQTAQHGFLAQSFSKMGAEQRMAMGIMIGSIYTAARLLNMYYNDGDPKWNFRHAFGVVIGNREYGIRTIASDVQRAITDTSQYISHRLSPIASSAFEFISKTDSMGKKETTADALKNIALRAVPMPLTPRKDLDLFESSVASMLGFYAKRYSPQSDVITLADEWRQKNDPSWNDSPTQYPESPYLKLRMSLQDNDLKTAKEEYDKVIEKHDYKNIVTAFNPYRPFTGSKATENDFVESLQGEHKQLYDEAIKEREQIFERLMEVAK